MMTFPSTLIIGNEYQTTLSKLGHSLVSNPDLFIIDENSGYKVETVRLINKFLQQLPYNHQNKVVLIKDAHLLEPVAQNALLKNLEEPGENNYFILTTQNISLILPTIISRCNIIQDKFQKAQLSNVLLANPTDIKSALEISSSIEKGIIKETLSNHLSQLHSDLITQPSPKLSQNINSLLKSLELIDSNVDPRLALDYYLLNQV